MKVVKPKLNLLLKALISAVFVLPLAVAHLSAAAAVSPVLQDTYSNAAAPAASHGGWASMFASATKRSFIEFELSSLLPAGTGADQVILAKLQLYQHFRTGAGSIEVVSVIDAFKETTTTWNVMPRDMGAGSGKLVALTDDVGTNVFVDVTSMVKAAVTAQETRIRFAIQGALATPGVVVELGTKEGAHGALLDITLASVGPAGSQGLAGPAGPTGPAGLKGATGATGPTGAAGVPGLNGAAGPSGLAGPVGPKGATGATGPTGVAGVPGLNGAAGPSGLAGPAGPKGAVGAQGVQGAQGAQGPQGPGGTMTTYWGAVNGVNCIFTCASPYGAVSSADDSGAVCKAQNGQKHGYLLLASRGETGAPAGLYCGSQQPGGLVAQCHCAMP